MIKIGITGNSQEEGEIYRTLRGCKEIEVSGLYNPERDFRSEKFKIYHNPIELLESSDAILIYNAERISADFIQQMIRKSKHIYFKTLPVLPLSELSDLLKLQKEAGSVIHLYNPLLSAKPEIRTLIRPGVKIVNMEFALKSVEKNLSSEIMGVLAYLCKIENSGVKHSDVLAFKNKEGQVTVNIHSLCSNGSVHHILLSDKAIHSDIQIFQKDNFTCFDFSSLQDTTPPEQLPGDISFRIFIDTINGKEGESISLENFYNSQKSYLDIREKLNYSGINI